MAHKGLSGQTLLLWESWVCTVQKRNHVVPCHCMLGPVPDLHLKAGFRQFSASPSGNCEPWWVTDSLSLQQKGKKRYSTRWRSTWSKPSSIINPYRVHPSKDPTNMQLCADKWRVAQLLSCQWCNPGSHRKRDWNMMRLNSPSLTFVFYIVPYSYYIPFCFIHKSSISDTILNFLNLWFTCTPNFRSPREPRIFVAQFFVPEDGHKMFSRRPFQGMKPDHQHIKSVKKKQKRLTLV